MSDRLRFLRTRSPRRVVGLNVGTSLDGIDAALLEVEGHSQGGRFRLVHYQTLELPSSIRKALMHPEDLRPQSLARLDLDLGLALADAALLVAKNADLGEQIDLVGSHGATVWHEPPRHDHEMGTTLQIGNAAVIAERTSAVVVSNFRAADMAASGQGAPLMPWLDHMLFQERPGTVLLNLGGIANLCYVSGEMESILAFDTGPANLPLNEIVRRLTKGRMQFDRGGRLASLGAIDRGLLAWLGGHRFLALAPPKSTGREEFGEDWTGSLLDRHRQRRLIDILATMTAFVALSVRRAVRDYISPRPIRQLLVSGGGVHNHTLMHHLKREFAPIPVQSFAVEGIDPDAKEAILFALLANDRIHDRPTGLPAATGALWPAFLGQITP